jgi:hypothetical protein
MFRREAESQRHVELGQRVHLAVEPVERVGTETIGPGQASPEMPDAEAAHPVHGIVQAMVLEVKPLAQSHGPRVVPEYF